MILEGVAGCLPSWFAGAACLGMPSAVFFPDRGETVAAAVEVCGRCPVAGRCLAYALDAGFTVGVFGGVNMASARERRQAASEAA